MNEIEVAISQLNAKFDIINEELKKLQDSFEWRMTKLENEVKSDAFQLRTRLDQLESSINQISDDKDLELIKNETTDKLNAKTEILIQMMETKNDKLNSKIVELERGLNLMERAFNDKSMTEMAAIRSDFNQTANRLTKINELKLTETHRRCTELNDRVEMTIGKYDNLFHKVQSDIQQAHHSLKYGSVQPKGIEMEWNDLEQKFSNQFNEIKSNVLGISDDLEAYKSEVFTWRITDMKMKMEQTTFECESEAFPVFGYHFGAKVKLILRENSIVFAAIRFIDSKNSGKPLGIKVLPRITYVIKDMSGNEEVKDIVRPFNFAFNSTVVYDSYCRERQLHHKARFLDSTYNDHDSVVLTILMEPPSIARSVHSKDGIMMWRIDNYQKKKNTEKVLRSNFQQSPYFYTSPVGYRVKLTMCLNGLVEYADKGLTVTVAFLTGEFDSTLSPSFVHETRLILFNQMNPTRHLTRILTIDLKNTDNYYINLDTHSRIETDGFIKNDSLLLKVIIRPMLTSYRPVTV